MNSTKMNNDSFRQWRSKRQRDPSEGRMRKRLITQAKKDQNEKENDNESVNRLEDTNKSDLNNKLELNNQNNNQINNPNNNPNNSSNNCLDNNSNNESSNKQSNNSMDQFNEPNDQMQLSSTQPINQTLKEKLASLNNSKFVIEEDEENEELANLEDELNDSEYDYDGEDLSENDENYFANEYPDDNDYNEIDFYRDYENDDEREMLEKFEKSWVDDDQIDYSEDDY